MKLLGIFPSAEGASARLIASVSECGNLFTPLTPLQGHLTDTGEGGWAGEM